MSDLKSAADAASAAYAERNPRSRRMAEEAARYLPGGNTRSSVWHAPFPLCMVRGEDCRLTDADGHEYLDFLGEFTAGIFGHSSPPVRSAIEEALGEGLSLSSHNLREARLAELICSRFPSIALLRFTNSGTEANLLALAAAKAATGRRQIMVFDGGYHGSLLSFLGGVSATTVPHEFLVGRYNDAEGSRALIERHRDDLAAVLVEPMLGSGGCIPGTPAFLETLRSATGGAGAILIFDEIQTSRLAIGGRQSLLGIRPDLTTLGKYFGGGLSFGCFGGRREIMERFDPRRSGALSHAGTFNNNTLSMAAGAAAVEKLLTAEALEALNARGDRLRESLLRLFARAGAPFTVTGLGSLMNIHPTLTGEPAAEARRLLFFELLSEGLYTAARGFIALSLPVTESHTERLLAGVERIIGTHRRALSSRRNLPKDGS